MWCHVSYFDWQYGSCDEDTSQHTTGMRYSPLISLQSCTGISSKSRHRHTWSIYAAASVVHSLKKMQLGEQRTVASEVKWNRTRSVCSVRRETGSAVLFWYCETGHRLGWSCSLTSIPTSPAAWPCSLSSRLSAGRWGRLAGGMPGV